VDQAARTFSHEPQWLPETHRLLDTYLETWQIPMLQIAREAGLGFDWLRKFRDRQFQDPGICKVERLRAYLLTQIPPSCRKSA